MKGKGALAVLLLVIVIIFFVYFIRTEDKAPIEEEVSRFSQTRAELTVANLESVSRAILEWMADGNGQVPDSINDFQKTRSYGLSFQDGWGRDIKYEKISDTSFRLRSAGQDGQFETDDDILKEY